MFLDFSLKFQFYHRIHPLNSKLFFKLHVCERPLPVVNRYTTIQAKASESFVHTACAATHRQPHKQRVLMRGYPCFRFAEHGVCYSECVCVWVVVVVGGVCYADTKVRDTAHAKYLFAAS